MEDYFNVSKTDISHTRASIPTNTTMACRYLNHYRVLLGTFECINGLIPSPRFYSSLVSKQGVPVRAAPHVSYVRFP